MKKYSRSESGNLEIWDDSQKPEAYMMFDQIEEMQLKAELRKH